MRNFFVLPQREYIVTAALVLGLAASFITPDYYWVLLAISITGSVTTLWQAVKDAWKRTITIDVFNSFALGASLLSGEIRSGAFIALMLSFARMLDWYTKSRSNSAVEELLKLKPLRAFRETSSGLEEVAVDHITKDDILVIKNGQRIPVDGVVTYGDSYVNEASLTGESKPVEKNIGDPVYSGTMNESGVIKIRATALGKDSTLERMAALIKEAERNKSRSQKLADRFAAIFFPIVGLAGLVTYLLTRDLDMTIALFLVACADDIAVAIPLAMTASLGQAAKRGVIVKGGEWLDTIGKVKTLVLDKTGTLTYGDLALRQVSIEPGISENEFWRLVAAAEKFSEHPVGRAVFRAALEYAPNPPDPEKFEKHKNGVCVTIDGHDVIIGTEEVFAEHDLVVESAVMEKLRSARAHHQQTSFLVFIDKKFRGLITVADNPRPEAAASLERLRGLGVDRIVMLTGDNEKVAADISATMGITEFYASIKPEGKLEIIERLQKEHGPLAMVGDGINDAPALARADVGIAMGAGGTAVAVEAADMVILTDDLSRIPEMVELGRRNSKAVWNNMYIWFITNAIGFALVFVGWLGPALAAFYNFATDFLPLLNSASLFRKKSVVIKQKQ